MSKLPNYAKRYHENSLQLIQRICRVSPKELANALILMDFDSFFKYLLEACSKTNNKLNYSILVKCDHTISMLHGYSHAKHFCLKDIQNVPEYKENVIGKSFSSEYFIDLKYGKHDMFINMYRRSYPLFFKDKRSDYNIEVMADIPTVESHNRANLGSLSPMTKQIALYCIHLCEDGRFIVELPFYQFYICSKVDVKVVQTTNTEEECITIDVDSLNSVLTDLRLPSVQRVLDIASHVVYCYNNRANLQRKNGKAKKRYECSTVHVAHTPTGNDRYVPLHTYTKEYEPSIRGEYKGGHHASPMPHERRGHYRKSRGRGDYSLVNGEFIYVGDKKGEYSYVSPTKVGKQTDDSVLIYKV